MSASWAVVNPVASVPNFKKSKLGLKLSRLRVPDQVAVELLAKSTMLGPAPKSMYEVPAARLIWVDAMIWLKPPGFKVPPFIANMLLLAIALATPSLRVAGPLMVVGPV